MSATPSRRPPLAAALALLLAAAAAACSETPDEPATGGAASGSTAGGGSRADAGADSARADDPPPLVRIADGSDDERERPGDTREAETGDGTDEDDTDRRPPSEAERARVLNERTAEMDRAARGLLESFEARVYAPPRDARVRFAEGVATVTVAGVTGEFAVTFDAALPRDDRIVVTRRPREGETRETWPALPQGTARQVWLFAHQSLNGPYRVVVNNLPPIPLMLTPSRDRTERVVTAPPHRAEVTTSYRFDERDLVSIRGTLVRPKREVVEYDWLEWHGRYLIAGTGHRGTDATTSYEYEDVDGAVLMTRATVAKKGARMDTLFTYERIDRRELDTAAVPQAPRGGDRDAGEQSGDPSDGTPPRKR